MAKMVNRFLLKYLTPLLVTITVSSLLLNVYLLKSTNKNNKFSPSLVKIVTRIIDGDTFDVEGDIRIRLAGADAPEYPKGCLSEQSKTRLSELILGKQVEIEEAGRDNFGRTIAFVFYDDLSINQTMVSEGLAKESSENESQYSSYLLSRQEEAQKAGRGIWSSRCTKPQNKYCLIKGNSDPKSGTKIYHLPNCFNYEKIVINEKDKDKWFCSEKEAQAAGFRKSSDCPESP